MRKKVIIITTELLLGFGSAITTSTMSKINPTIGIVLTSGTALLTNFPILITNEYISKLKIRHSMIRDWMNVFTLLYERTLKTSMMDKNIDAKEAVEMKKNYILYLDKRKKYLKKNNVKLKIKSVI